MKRNAIARIIIYSILALVLTGILLGFLFEEIYLLDYDADDGTVVTGEVSIDADSIQKLEINWAAGAVNINTDDTDQITFRESAPENSKYQMVYNVHGNTLELNYSSRGGISIGFGNHSIPSKDLTITVPQDWVCEQIEIDGASLIINIQHLTMEKLDMDGAANNLGFVGSVEQVDVDGASNNIHLNCENHPTLIDIDGASCDLDVILPKGCGFAVDMEGLSCDFHSDLDYTTKNGQHIYGNGHTNINVDGISCDVTISESVECTHVWDSGQEMIIPGGIETKMVYTCTICGETKSETIPHTKHTWDSGTSLGGNSVVYHCTQCDETKTVTVEAERHGFIWQDWETRKLLETQIFEPGYYEGAELVFKTEIFAEYSLELYCDGEFICGPTVVGDHWEFYYTMPDHIVYIELRKVYV